VAATDSAKAAAKLRLAAIGTRAPREFALRGRRITIGTAIGNDLLLTEPTASRRHAAIERRWTGWRVIDLGSSNGTYLNGRRIAGTAHINRGDEVRFGDARFVVIATGDDPVRLVAEREQTSAHAGRSGRPRIWVAMGIAAVVVALSFIMTLHLVNQDLHGRGADLATTGVATPAAASAIVPAAHGSGTAGASTTESAPVSEPQWLARLNYYRAALGLAAVSEDPALSAADTLHARYLVKTYAEDIRHSAIGADAHEENSASPWYTEQGRQAGKSSDVSYWQVPRTPAGEPLASAETMPEEMPWGSPGWSIDGWMSIPFHRLSLINPYLQRSGFGRYCEDAICAAALDTLSDLKRLPENPVPLPHGLEFPPPDGSIGMRALDSEWPDPITSCAGYRRPAGLAVTLALGSNIDARLTQFRITDKAGSAAIGACGFDSSSYINPDAVAQQRGRDVLRNFGAVVVIPREPLKKGATYNVSMTVSGGQYRWSFSTTP